MPQQFHYDIAEICSLKGIHTVVMSPGSRCAPITISMARHPKLKTFVIPDERSAGFIALGIAEKTKQTCALLCTSGTASINYYPAITEAYYRGIPLIVFTADRPPELIDQWDGQTIRQNNIYKNHILKSFVLPTDFTNNVDREYGMRLMNEAINLAQNSKGPVHVNIPLRDPLYPKENEEIKYSTDLKIITEVPINRQIQSTSVKKELNTFKRILIVVGQMEEDDELNTLLHQISQDEDAVIIGDHIANLKPKESFINCHDLIINSKNKESLKTPDLVITLGRSILSKRLKEYLRSIPDVQHWQIGNYDLSDTYNALSKIVRINERKFISATQSFFESESSFFKSWWDLEKKQRKINEELKFDEFSELSAVLDIMKKIPKDCDLHLSNSLSTRYANHFQQFIKDGTKVFCNRGTSGIDGCTSTAVGHALSTKRTQILITGDVAFFYDRNALWHNYSLKNLRIVLLNNHGGGIFRVIDGPRKQNELEEFFHTRQNLNAKNTSEDFNLKYAHVNNDSLLQQELSTFFESSKDCKLLEIETDKILNEKVYRNFLNKP